MHSTHLQSQGIHVFQSFQVEQDYCVTNGYNVYISQSRQRNSKQFHMFNCVHV